jgi:cellulose biosynthesis protein BcsQ
VEKSSGLDDLAWLLSETDLNPATYKTFVNAEIRPANAPDPRPVEAIAEVRAEPASDAIVPAHSNQESDLVLRPVNEKASGVGATLKNLALFSSWGTWVGLDLVFGNPFSGKSRAELAPFRQPRKCSFVIGGISGGVGATSIATSLARLCARAGGRALLLDPSPSSVLPLYFGSRSTRLQLSSLVLPGDPRGSAVHICRRTAPYANDAVGNWAQGAIESLAADTDSLFIDAGQVQGNRLFSELGGGLVRIITITPETRCLSRLVDFEEDLDNSRLAADSVRPLLLLNQFDPAESLHVEIRSRLQRRFPERMIPIAVRHGKEVSAALAEGATVLDYAPDSSVAEDLRELYCWLEEQHPVPSRVEFNHEVQAL